MSLATTLRRLAADRALRAIDVALAIRLGELAGRALRTRSVAGTGVAGAGAVGDPAPFHDASCLAGLLASKAIEAGHACMPLAAMRGELAAIPWPTAGVPDPPDDQALRQIELAGLLGREARATPRPLVLEHDRLYLQRYAALEQECAERLAAMLRATPEPVTTTRLRPDSADYLFARSDARLGGATNWQAVACAVSLRHRLSVLSGGPGTGKTWTLAVIALLLLERANASNTPCRIALAAPTGKAAQRLRETLAGRLAEFKDRFAVREADLTYLENSGKTLHRLLGYRPDQVEFRHDQDRPLDVECVVVDECSMVDLPLLTRLLRALRPGTRLILVGDRQQLFPVEAGSVFAELFSLCGVNRFDTRTAAAIGEACDIAVPTEPAPALHPLAGHVTCLEYSFRAEQRIAAIARAIQHCGTVAATGDARPGVDTRAPGADPVSSLLERLVPGDDEARLVPVTARAVPALVAKRCAAPGGWFAELRAADTPAAALRALERFRILCALRRGPLGVTGLNAAIEAALFDNPALLSRHYHLRPILITQNDYRLRLYNGDVGVIFEEHAAGETRSRACFPGSDGEAVRRLTPTQLPPHETCYAMTIHKSQGSEFDEIVVVLPAGEDGTRRALLTRELLYTGISRARKAVELWSDPDVLAETARRATQRYSGLPERLVACLRSGA